MINTDFGFLQTIKPIQRTRAEKVLNKLYKHEDGIYDVKTYLVNQIISGLIPVYKDEYMLYNETEKWWYSINKTEYNFCKYCYDNGFITQEAIDAYIKQEQEILRQKEEQEKKIQEENIKKQEKRIKIQEIIKTELSTVNEQTQKLICSIFNTALDMEKEKAEQIIQAIKQEIIEISEEAKKIMYDIYFYTYNKEPYQGFYDLIILVNHFDEPIFKQKLMELLHNDNKASIKAFEHLTGLKLPKSYKKRIEFLYSIKSKDFKGMVVFKPRKNKTAIKEEFYDAIKDDNNNLVWSKVLAEPYNKYGLEFYIKKQNDLYTLCCATSGCIVTSDKTKTVIFNKLKETINQNGIDKFKQCYLDVEKEIYSKIGVNPRYK